MYCSIVLLLIGKAYTKNKSRKGGCSLHIKGYVKDIAAVVPVTWERESKKYVFNVRKVVIENEQIVFSDRLFDEKIPKDEILLPFTSSNQ